MSAEIGSTGERRSWPPTACAAGERCGARDAASGRCAGDHRARPGAGHLHSGAGYHHRQCLAAHHRGQPGRIDRPVHLDHHLLCRRQWHRRAVDRLADEPLRRGQGFRSFHAGLHRRLAIVRHRLEPGIADFLPYPAGRAVGADDSRLAGADALDIPAEQRTTALAIWSITTLVAPICGPILGGYISDPSTGAGYS